MKSRSQTQAGWCICWWWWERWSLWQEAGMWRRNHPAPRHKAPRVLTSLAVAQAVSPHSWAAQAKFNFRLHFGLHPTQAGLCCTVLVRGGAVNPSMKLPSKHRWLQWLFYRQSPRDSSSHDSVFTLKYSSCWTRLFAFLVPFPIFSSLSSLILIWYLVERKSVHIILSTSKSQINDFSSILRSQQ